MNIETYKQNTTIEKCSYNGWEATTHIELEALDSNEKRVIIFSTLKRSRGISTNATVFVINAVTHSKTTAIFEDYSQPVKASESKRATEKTVKEAHDQASSLFDDHIAKAKIQYGIGG